MKAIKPGAKGSDQALFKEGKKLLSASGVLEITEFGRSVHAEMEALLACARCGVSPRGATLYCTTFPCHNCAKHIIAAGVKRVVYIEPYPKSRAVDLHADAFETRLQVESEREPQSKVICEPFQGIGPRRFIDLFALRSATGLRLRRSTDGKLNEWNPKSALLKVPLIPLSYLGVETLVAAEVEKLLAERTKDSVETKEA